MKPMILNFNIYQTLIHLFVIQNFNSYIKILINKTLYHLPNFNQNLSQSMFMVICLNF
mgnify:CR=1 FL=1